MAVTLRARLVSSFGVSWIRHFMLAVTTSWGVLALSVPQQALDWVAMLGRNFFEHQELIAPVFKLSKGFRHRNTRDAQLPECSAFSLHAGKAVLAVPIGIAMPPPLFNHNQSSRISGKIERLKDTSLSALCKSFADQVFKTDGTVGFSGARPLLALKRIFRPVRHRSSRATSVQVRLSFSVYDVWTLTVDTRRKRAITVIDDAILPIPRVKRNSRRNNISRRRV